jgi:hypothetical protein
MAGTPTTKAMVKITNFITIEMIAWIPLIKVEAFD